MNDSFGRRHTYLRISVTDRCNLRCAYCMPPQGIALRPRDEFLTFDEIERTARLLAGMGITKTRITGGEPLVRKGVPDLIHRLSEIHGIETIGMTTNGVLLKKNLPVLRQSGLSRLNISLDTLQRKRFERITLRDHLYDVLESIDAAIEGGFVPLKLNTVIMKGVNDDEIHDFVELAKNKPINVRFIEYMPFKFNRWSDAGFVSYEEMKRVIEERYKLLPVEKGGPYGVARDFRIEGFAGNISFITSMSDHFCAACNRLRLTSDGSIKSCLFHPAEVNIRTALRSRADDEEIGELIRSALLMKPREHRPVRELAQSENRTMIEIGG